MTAFQTKLLNNLTAEILLGQIYNYVHGYDETKKKHSAKAIHGEVDENATDYDRYVYVKHGRLY